MNVVKTNNPQQDTINTTAEVYKAMKAMILQNQILPDIKINQGRIAEELGVSRTPVVKALHKLESEGLVDNIPQKGFYVHTLSVKELLELFALREALESIVIDSLADIITREQMERLEVLFSPFQGEWTPQDKRLYWAADRQFHDLQLEWCDNALAKRVNDMFQVLDRTYLGGLVRDPKETLEEHKAILEALGDRDRERAREQATRHIAKTRELLQNTANHMRKLGIDPAATAVSSLLKE